MNTPRHQRFGTGLVDGEVLFRSRFKVCTCAIRNNVIMAKCMQRKNLMQAGDEKLNFNE